MHRVVRIAQLAYGFWRNRLPKQLIIQLTDRCNARCPQCGMRVTQRYPRTTLDVDQVKRRIDEAAARGVEALSITGGEPLLERDAVVELLHYAGRAGIRYLRTGTNGFTFRNVDDPRFDDRVTALAEQLAATPLRNFWISIDSAVPEVHDAMRGFPGVMAGIERAVPIFQRAGLYPSANLGLNRNVGGAQTAALRIDQPGHAAQQEAFYQGYRQGFRRFYRRVLDLGFTLVNACYPMSVEPDHAALSAVYQATSADDIVRYSAAEKAELFRALADTIPEYRGVLRIFSPLCSLLALMRQYRGGGESAYACRGGLDFFFVDSRDGGVYPCGYRGRENLGANWHRTLRQAGAPECRQCDWECFRDPSEMFGPLLEGFSHPWRLWQRWRRDREYFRLWLNDFRYHFACNLFDGRTPPDPLRLRPFGRPVASEEPSGEVQAERPRYAEA